MNDSISEPHLQLCCLELEIGALPQKQINEIYMVIEYIIIDIKNSDQTIHIVYNWFFDAVCKKRLEIRAEGKEPLIHSMCSRFVPQHLRDILTLYARKA